MDALGHDRCVDAAVLQNCERRNGNSIRRQRIKRWRKTVRCSSSFPGRCHCASTAPDLLANFCDISIFRFYRQDGCLARKIAFVTQNSWRKAPSDGSLYKKPAYAARREVIFRAVSADCLRLCRNPIRTRRNRRYSIRNCRRRCPGMQIHCPSGGRFRGLRLGLRR